MKQKEKFLFITEYFLKHRPNAETELIYAGPFELLVAVILSAQCTDKRVNMVTPDLFAQFPSASTMAKASASDIYPFIKSISYPNNKSKHLVGLARMLIEKFNGIVPGEIDELQKLPGVGRKTANVIASVIYEKPTMAVDTHVFRVSERIGLTYKAKTPLAAEKQLVKYFPEDIIPLAHHWLILHGRYICTARKPKCIDCGIKEVCDYYKNSTIKSMRNTVS